MRYKRQAALAGAVLCAGFCAAGFAQQPLDSVVAGETQCTTAQLGAPIEARQIGEPVSAVRIDKVQWYAASERTPALCVVEGQLLPVDTATSAQPIRFAVALPATWNRRSIHQGGGGMNGSVPQFAPGPQRAGFPGAPPSDAARGFAVYGSDSGHGQDPQWALNDEAIRNFGYAQLKKTHDVAQLLIKRMYGMAPRYRYFVGTSQGGREALTVAQRYPGDYEGIAANVPVLSLGALMAAPSMIRRQELSLANWVPSVKSRAIAAEFMHQCDALDGLDDGVINDYLQCRAIFNVHDSSGPKAPWAARRCPDNRDPDPADASEHACLTDGQIATLQFIFSPHSYDGAMANGTRSFGMWLPSTEVVSGGMPGNALLADIRFKGQEGAAADARAFNALGTNGFTGFVFGELAANPLLVAFTPAVLKRQREVSAWVDSTNPDLGAFERRGGKLIVAIGTNDTLASPGAQLDYYAALQKKMGSRRLDGFARLYVLPQRGHGLQGNHYVLAGDGSAVAATPLPSQFDRLALLQKWVEQGEAPASAQTVTGQNGATGLMCSYPQHPQYAGGDAALAAAWRCRD